jgi:hypothetical protein
MTRRHLFLLLAAVKLGVLVAIAAPVWSADGTPASAPITAALTASATAADFANAVATFRRASDGDSHAIEPALAQFGTLLQAQPNDPLLLAYAGATTAMQARTTLLPWKKMRHAEDGLAQIDRALALLTPAHDTELRRGVPVGLETRLTAAGTFLALPSLFHRGERGRRLIDEVLKHPAFATTPAEFQAAARQTAAKVAS